MGFTSVFIMEILTKKLLAEKFVGATTNSISWTHKAIELIIIMLIYLAIINILIYRLISHIYRLQRYLQKIIC